MLEVVAAVAIIGFVIYQQLAGQTLRGKKVVLLPVILTVIGVTNLSGGGRHLQPVDVVCLAVGCAMSIAIGLAFGAIMRLESRDGVLWARMPVKGLWLWAALIASRGVMYAVAVGLHAHVAASGAPLLLALGLNRLAQAAVVVPRAFSAGVPFAPEKDGTTFMSGVLGGAGARPGFTRTGAQYSQSQTYQCDDHTDYPGRSTGQSGSVRPDDGPVDLSTFGSGYREQPTRMDQRPAQSGFGDGHLPRTDWRRLAATAADRLGGNR